MCKYWIEACPSAHVLAVIHTKPCDNVCRNLVPKYCNFDFLPRGNKYYMTTTKLCQHCEAEEEEAAEAAAAESAAAKEDSEDQEMTADDEDEDEDDMVVVKEEQQDEYPKQSKVSTPAKNTRSTARSPGASASSKKFNITESASKKRKGTPMVVVKNAGPSPNKKIKKY